ncbi:MAG: BON domain-containing protein [Chloroflexota bacterium]
MDMSRQSELIDAVTARLLNHEATAEAGIEVLAEGQQVWLRGEVTSQAIKDEAETVAKSVPGVIQVINELYVVDEDADTGLRGVPPIIPHKSQ